MCYGQTSTPNYPPEMPGARLEVYKTIGNTELKLYIFDPADRGSATKHAAIVFFFGGGWRGGTPAQFGPQCRHFASRGMVAIAADYRVSSRHGTTAMDSVRDAKSAVRYVRQNAPRLGIDPQRIAAAGGSAGGHLAAAAGIIRGLDERGEDASVSSRPNALVLFNPALVLAPVPDQAVTRGLSDLSSRPEFRGFDPVAISPWHHVTRNEPPTIIFHGTADTTVPFATVESFTKKMRSAGNQCDLAPFEGQIHGFFNYQTNRKAYEETLQRADEFLTKLRYTKPQ
jgi:acetyl esterase/lipase